MSDPRRLRTETRRRHDGLMRRDQFARTRRFTPEEIAMLNGDPTAPRLVIAPKDEPTRTLQEQAEEIKRLCDVRIKRLSSRVEADTFSDEDELSLLRMSQIVKGLLVEEGKQQSGDPSRMSDEQLAKLAKG